MSHPYTEDQLVEQPALQLFAALGWKTVSAIEEAFGPGSTLGRETKGEMMLRPRLQAALERLNPTLLAKEVIVADKVTAGRFAVSIQPSLQPAETLKKATRILRRARDLLLSRLLSGQVTLAIDPSEGCRNPGF